MANNAPNKSADTPRVADEASVPALYLDWSAKQETKVNSEAKVGDLGSIALLRTLTPRVSNNPSLEKTLSPRTIIENSPYLFHAFEVMGCHMLARALDGQNRSAEVLILTAIRRRTLDVTR